jgi:dTMP kinase
MVPIAVSEARRRGRPSRRDRMEEEDREFFERMEAGYEAAAAAEPERIRRIDARKPATEVGEEIWEIVTPCLPRAKKARGPKR